MQTVELIDVVLKKEWKDSLLKANFTTVAEVLISTPHLISRRAKLSFSDVQEILLELSFSFRNQKVRTVAEILSLEDREIGEREGASEEEKRLAEIAYKKSHNWISVGDEGLDALLGNGVKIGGITEIAGQSASGKSHLCLQLALTVQLPHALGGQSGGTILVSSEGIIPSSRLLSIAQSLISRLPEGTNSSSRNEWDFMDNVHVEKAQDVENLGALLSFIAPARIDRVNLAASQGVELSSELDYSIPSTRTSLPLPPLPIKLLIIDSIAAPFRTAHENDSGGFIARAKDFGMVGDRLKRLANIYGLAIVVVNQVSDVFENTTKGIPATHHLPLDLVETMNDQPELSRNNSIKTPFVSSRNNSKVDSSTTTTTTTKSNKKISIPAHIQFQLPSYLYSRYQQPHFSGQISPSSSSTSTSSNLQHNTQAALGHTWTNIINTRIMLSRTERSYTYAPSSSIRGEGSESVESDDLGSVLGGGERGRRRRMELVFSPSAARGGIDYALEESGLRSLGEPEWNEIRD